VLSEPGVLHLTGPALDAYARFDGFDDFDAMAGFFARTHATDVFQGWHILWGNLWDALDP
jgi:hypothetical protein